jgi:DNA mismatch repair protein MutS2
MEEHSLRTLEFHKVLDILAEQTACSLGRELALAARPVSDRQVVRRMQRETAEAADLLSRRGNVPLGGITDIRPLLQRAVIGGTLEPSDLLDIASTAESGRQLRAFLQKAGLDMIPTLMPYADRIGQFVELENAIRKAIAPNGTLLDSASPELSRVRSRRRTTEQRLVDRLNAYISGGQRTMLQDPVIVQRDDRSCLAVKAEHRGAFGGIVHDTSSSGATLFIEPAPVVEIGNEVRELEAAERREVIRILTDLSGRAGRAAGSLLSTLEVLAQLDLIVARARLAHKQRAVEPTWNERGAVRLMSARHPLIDDERVVAIDVIVGEPKENQVVIITGPNTGGKTATLKTVGLLTLMAQTGLHVPAARGDMNCFDEVFADIGDEQSIQQSLSTFSGHITTIARFAKELRPNSLVLLDEVGAGTDPGEGASLARALLEHFRMRSVRVMATSHYGELKTYAFTTEGVQNASVEFDESTLRPTYRVIQGVPGSSNAYAIAARLGIPDEVINHARENQTGTDASVEIMQELETARRQALDERVRAEKLRRDADTLHAMAESELAKFERMRAEIREQVLAEAREVVRTAQTRANELLRQIRENQQQVQAEQARQLIGEIEAETIHDIDRALDLHEHAAVVEEEPDQPDGRALKSGDRVRVSPIGLIGNLIDDVDGKDRVAVQVGSVRLSVDPDSLRLISSGKTRSASGPAFRTRITRSAAGAESGAGSLTAAAAVSPQLSLIGQRADEAHDNLERYLYDATAAGLDRVRIVHGKGTGALRRVVQEYLRGNSMVAEFTTAEPGEGGSGATVVRLNESG